MADVPFILSTESVADMTVEKFASIGVEFIPFHFSLNGKEYSDDCFHSLSAHDFYMKMGKGEMTRTSQVSVGEYVAFFEKFLKEGKDILHLSLSSGLSGTYQSAHTALGLLKDKYPERKILLVDTLGASTGIGLQLDTLSRMRADGKSIEECYKFEEENKLNLNHVFFSTDLEYYVRGGRITKAEGFWGKTFHVCPLLDMNDAGKLIPRSKCITAKLAEFAMVKKVETLIRDGLEYADKIFMCQSDCMKLAKPVADSIEKKFHKLMGKVEIYSVGPTIGSHTGPGTVSIFFWGQKRGE